MQLYAVDTAAGTRWHGTRAEAHNDAKLRVPRDDVRIYLWEVQASKDDVLAMLDGKKPRRELVGAWMLSARGGLVEMPLDKAKSEMDCFAGDPGDMTQGPSQDELDDL